MPQFDLISNFNLVYIFSIFFVVYTLYICIVLDSLFKTAIIFENIIKHSLLINFYVKKFTISLLDYNINKLFTNRV